MFGGGYKGTKLRVNLRLAINRLKLLQKKKTEQAVKARKEIAEYLQLCKAERARIRVEHIIREDYMVEAMEVLEMYCDLLLARFGLIETMKYCDEGLTEAVCTLIWVAPRLQSDIAEMKLIADQLVLKYGKTFGEQSRANSNGAVNERVIHRMGSQAPPRALVEGYLVEIAQSHHIAFTPDEDALHEMTPSSIHNEKPGFFPHDGEGGYPPDDPPPPFSNHRGGGGGGGGMGQAVPPSASAASHVRPVIPAQAPTGHVPPTIPAHPAAMPHVQPAVAASYQMPPAEPRSPWAVAPPGAPSANDHQAQPPYPSPADNRCQQPYPPSMDKMAQPPYPGGYSAPPTDAPRYVDTPPAVAPPGASAPPPSFPDLPSVPQDPLPGVGSASTGADDLDFDDLTRRFEDLKRKK